MVKSKKVFAICDLEEAYVVRLADYLNANGGMPYQVLAFTNLESLTEYAAGHAIEILLISTDAMTDEVKKLNVKRTIILSDGEDVVPKLRCGKEEPQEFTIDKYQDGDAIARQVMQITGMSMQQEVQMPADCSVVGVYSPIGRCGKTLFSLTLAQIAGETGRTLYLNMENYSGFEALFQTTYRSDLADMLYVIRQNRGSGAEAAGYTVQMNGVLTEELEHDAIQIGNFEIIPPAFFSDDIGQVTAEAWVKALADIAAAGAYRSIILDIGTQIRDVPEILKVCERIYMPILPDPVSRAKISQFEKNMESLSMGEMAAAMVRLYLPEVQVKNAGIELIDALLYGKMGQFVRRLAGEEGRLPARQ